VELIGLILAHRFPIIAGKDKSNTGNTPMSERIKVSCGCGKTLIVSEKHAGKTLECPACTAPVRIPGGSVPDVDEAPFTAVPSKEHSTGNPWRKNPKPTDKTSSGLSFAIGIVRLANVVTAIAIVLCIIGASNSLRQADSIALASAAGAGVASIVGSVFLIGFARVAIKLEKALDDKQQQ